MCGGRAAALVTLCLLAQAGLQAAAQAEPPRCSDFSSDIPIPDLAPADPDARLHSYFRDPEDDGSTGQEFTVLYKREVLLTDLPSRHQFVLGSFVPEQSSPVCHTYDAGERWLSRRKVKCPRPARTVVTYTCEPGTRDHVIAASSNTDCEYWLQVATGRVCAGEGQEHVEL